MLWLTDAPYKVETVVLPSCLLQPLLPQVIKQRNPDGRCVSFQGLLAPTGLVHVRPNPQYTSYNPHSHPAPDVNPKEPSTSFYLLLCSLSLVDANPGISEC